MPCSAASAVSGLSPSPRPSLCFLHHLAESFPVAGGLLRPPEEGVQGQKGLLCSAQSGPSAARWGVCEPHSPAALGESPASLTGLPRCHCALGCRHPGVVLGHEHGASGAESGTGQALSKHGSLPTVCSWCWTWVLGGPGNHSQRQACIPLSHPANRPQAFGARLPALALGAVQGAGHSAGGPTAAHREQRTIERVCDLEEEGGSSNTRPSGVGRLRRNLLPAFSPSRRLAGSREA